MRRTQKLDVAPTPPSWHRPFCTCDGNEPVLPDLHRSLHTKAGVGATEGARDGGSDSDGDNDAAATAVAAASPSKSAASAGSASASAAWPTTPSRSASDPGIAGVCSAVDSAAKAREWLL